jgi:6-phospho-3-hexuloisomerase
MSGAAFTEALKELGAALNGIDPRQIDHACRLIEEADRIVLYGAGREGLMMRALCMRLFHMGLKVAMVGDMTTPPVGVGDLFFASSGPGTLGTAGELMRLARGAGAEVLLVTAEARAPLAPLAGHLLVIPGQTMASDQTAAASAVLPMGSVFEGAMFVLFEVMVARLKESTGITADMMRANHTNIE